MAPLRRSFQIIIVRHGERVDAVFGQEWIHRFFSVDGQYVRQDLNMPATLPPRSRAHWAADPPLTELGHWQARQVGDALAGLASVAAIVSSPAARCLQTAEEIRQCLPGCPSITVEPGLLEMGSWCAPLLNGALQETWEGVGELPGPDEGVEEWYHRSDLIMRLLMERHAEKSWGDLLIVAHGLSHETLLCGSLWGVGPVPEEVRKATGHQAKVEALFRLARQGTAPIDCFCGLAMVRYSRSRDEVNPLETCQALALTHRGNEPFVYMPSMPPDESKELDVTNGVATRLGSSSADSAGRNLLQSPWRNQALSQELSPSVPLMIPNGDASSGLTSSCSNVQVAVALISKVGSIAVNLAAIGGTGSPSTQPHPAPLLAGPPMGGMSANLPLGPCRGLSRGGAPRSSPRAVLVQSPPPRIARNTQIGGPACSRSLSPPHAALTLGTGSPPTPVMATGPRGRVRLVCLGKLPGGACSPTLGVASPRSGRQCGMI